MQHVPENITMQHVPENNRINSGLTAGQVTQMVMNIEEQVTGRLPAIKRRLEQLRHRVSPIPSSIEAAGKQPENRPRLEGILPNLHDIHDTQTQLFCEIEDLLDSIEQYI